MARLPRVYIEGVLYYVTSRGGHNQSVFRTPTDYLEYMGLISKYKEQYGFKLFAFALLPTHLHMLVELKNNIGISNIMHDINSLYTKTFNAKYKTKGHLFEARFKTAMADKDTNLLGIVRHIHRNPKRERIVYDPKDYPYSSHGKYLDRLKSQEAPEMVTEIKEAFKKLNGTEEAFSNFVNNISRKDASEMKKRLKKRIIGPKAFRERIRKMIEKSSYQTQPARKLKVMRRVYGTIGAAALLGVAALSVFFAKQHTELMTEYDRKIAVYDRTIKTLKAEQVKAAGADKGAGEYSWKIRVAEESLSNLKRERDEAVMKAKEVEGRSWRVRFTQISGPAAAYVPQTDTLFFKVRRVGSKRLAAEGFSASNFSASLDGDGDLLWETIQNNADGRTASWRGKWDGRRQRGVLSIASPDGISRAFSFISFRGQ